MPKYSLDFKKTVWGYVEVQANSKEEAEEKFEDGEYDEFDNNSEYDYGEWMQE